MGIWTFWCPGSSIFGSGWGCTTSDRPGMQSMDSPGLIEKQLWLSRPLSSVPFVPVVGPRVPAHCHAFVTTHLDYCNALYMGLPLEHSEASSIAE